jgi:hypothetical protein
MINKLKTFAITMMVAGATATATTASAAVNTNTFTNVIQSLQFTLTAYSNAPVKNATSETGEKPVAITTKSIITALSNASGSIPSLVGFNWGKSPQLVMETTFASTNIVTLHSNAVATNTIVIGAPLVSFSTNTNTYPTNGTQFAVVDTNGTATLTNVAGGTNGLTVTGSWTNSSSNVTGTAVTFIGTNAGATNVLSAIPTNAGLWTVFKAATNASGSTNVTAVTYTNTPSTATNFFTNSLGIEIQGGTATSPTFANVSSYVFAAQDGSTAIITATGTGFGTTNAVTNATTSVGTGEVDITVFNTNASTALGNNLDLGLDGFFKSIAKYDVLHMQKGLTNQVGESTFTATVSGSGTIGGSYVNTNFTGGPAVNVNNFANEFIGGVVTNGTITGILTNPVSVVVTGTVTLGAPKNVAQ